jgi:hypothetical protein
MPDANGRARVMRDMVQGFWMVVGRNWCYRGVVDVMVGEKNFMLCC